MFYKLFFFTEKICNILILKYKKVNYDKSIEIKGKIYIHGNGQIVIGKNVVIQSKKTVNPIAGGHNTHLRTGDRGKIIIGNNVGMSHVNITSMESVILEDNVFLGSCVKIWDTDFHSLNYHDRINNDINADSSPVHIGEGAFIGACSIILKGVNIGKHSVIGAGSIVTKNIPMCEIWAGNPAKFIRKLQD